MKISFRFRRFPFMRFAILLWVFCTPFTAFSQKGYSSANPKAIRTFEMALKFYDARQNEKALEALKTTLEADPNFTEAHMLRANIYSDLNMYSKAIESYEAAIKSGPDFFPNNYYSLAKAQFLNGLYRDARMNYEKFLAYPKINQGLAANARKYIKNCLFAEQAVNNPVNFDPKNMGEAINSPDPEYFPAITADGKTFLFTRRSKTILMGRSTEQEDFYVSKNTGGKWNTAVALTEINTPGNEGAPSLSADGQYLFFTACEELQETAGARKTKGSCDIFLAKKVGEKFNAPRNLEVPINSSSWESQPSFSSDGRTLYFIRAIKSPSGKTQRDIMVSSISDKSEWSEPVPLPDHINTPDEEMSVFIHPDDQTLYFASDGHPGMGGLDIFMCRRTPSGEWGMPVNLGYPFNTSGDENSLLVSPDGSTGFFASDRPGGFGGLDLYSFALPEQMRPIPVTYMKGKVFDAETKKPLSASFELIDLATGKLSVSSTSNAGNGEFLVCLPAGKSYALNVAKDGYLFFSENFSLRDASSSKEPFLKDVPLQPVKVGQSVVLKNIFFDFDKSDLKPESKIELDKLISFLQKNTSVKIEISGHTDNVGSKTYNQNLSERRAQSVSEFLTKNGVPASRIQFKGYGDTVPIEDNATDEGRSRNRRTEFKVISVN
ncbi:MAG: hypothetical protein DWQ44_03125 [Bacteroidetes bacterium]|nr:MAG: hypothetical protein DWQ33_04680 [Bacteroidota bacterium]REK00006.1 MAG: hypothetical protein DWQ39_13950 [Bacteroidota bacterium]REK35815.1 MAG: hypothetical protein DWQ44_03125 [Bacteroidota bacterium]REK49314.1 MAG: hypothetical protein DWQ48_07730 [Bacteroidota bacterium]